MLRLILAVVLVAACLAFPAEKESRPSQGFQQAFSNYGGEPAGFGEGGMQDAGMMNGMNQYGGGQFQSGGYQQPQKRDPSHHEHHHSQLQAFEKHRFGNEGGEGNRDNFGNDDFNNFFRDAEY